MPVRHLIPHAIANFRQRTYLPYPSGVHEYPTLSDGMVTGGPEPRAGGGGMDPTLSTLRVRVAVLNILLAGGYPAYPLFL